MLTTTKTRKTINQMHLTIHSAKILEPQIATNCKEHVILENLAVMYGNLDFLLKLFCHYFTLIYHILVSNSIMTLHFG